MKNNLFLFQYPLRPNDRFYGDHGEIYNISINKPEKSAVKIHYNIDPKNQFSDKNFQENKVVLKTFNINKIYLNKIRNTIKLYWDKNLKQTLTTALEYFAIINFI